MVQLLYGADSLVAEYVKQQLHPDIDDFGSHKAIGVVSTSQLIAGVVYNNFIGRDIHASIASTNARWANKKVLYAFFAYPFLQLECTRITAQTRAGNIRTQSFLTRLGFAKEGILREWYANDDDAIIYGILKHECRWINNIREEING